MRVFGVPWGRWWWWWRCMQKASPLIKAPCRWSRLPARPRGCWPFKRRGRRRGASCLRCFCLSVSERSWAEAAERISRGQVRKAKQVPLSSLRGFLCVRLCVFLHFDALRTRRLLVSETSFVKRRFSPFPRSAPLLSSPLLSAPREVTTPPSSRTTAAPLRSLWLYISTSCSD